MGGRYYSLNEYLKNTFGEKVYKLSIDLGLSCPNRDGTLDTRGCIFCLAGSSHFAAQKGNVNEKIEKAKALVAKKTKAEKFIAYFQSYTNTYGDLGYLRESFFTAAMREDVVALSIGTRPDCLPADVLELLEELNRIKPVWVELGLQTSKVKTAKYIRRCYENQIYLQAVENLKKRSVQVITHIILGLPGETTEDMLSSVDFAVSAGTNGLKLQLLHVLKGTDLERDYRSGRFKTLELEEYLDILFLCLERVPRDVVIHRLTGDAPKAHLVAPLWSADKKRVLNTMNQELEKRDVWQGRYTSE